LNTQTKFLSHAGNLRWFPNPTFGHSCQIGFLESYQNIPKHVSSTAKQVLKYILLNSILRIIFSSYFSSCCYQITRHKQILSVRTAYLVACPWTDCGLSSRCREWSFPSSGGNPCWPSSGGCRGHPEECHAPIATYLNEKASHCCLINWFWYVYDCQTEIINKVTKTEFAEQSLWNSFYKLSQCFPNGVPRGAAKY